MAQTIRFFHRGRMVDASGGPPTRTVLQWLREDARCTGTKEGCAEGDCGACTVWVGEPDGHGGLALATVNACIRLLPTLHGKALFTVEDLGAPGAPHPAQQALVDCHGSQCGFCTPGFVMSLALLHRRHQAAGTRPQRPELADALSGNLCRCTGYRPILDAGERMFDLPGPGLDTRPAVEALARDAAAPTGEAAPGQRFWAPRTLDELAALRQAHPQATLLAGGTDIGLWVTKKQQALGDILWLGDVAELRTITRGDGVLTLGAGASLHVAWQALAEAVPALAEMGLRFASPPIRHAGTLGGNIANGSPIGDGAPVLMALDAKLLLRCGAATRRLPLDGFYTGYMKNQFAPGEFLQAIEVPVPGPGTQVRAYKLSKRFDSDISAVSLGTWLALDGQRVRGVRLAFGGLAATVARAQRAEAAMVGQPWTENTLAAAQAALGQDFQPLTDLRASAGYRLQAAQALLKRLWLATRPGDPLPDAALTVWPLRSYA